MKRTCKYCDLISDNDELFVPTYRKEGERRNICWECHRNRSKKYRKKFRDKRLKIIRKHKNVPCDDCGNEYPYYVMDFDHVSGIKLFTIGDGYHNATLDEIINEISKCDVVCSNCHRIRTFNMSKNKS